MTAEDVRWLIDMDKQGFIPGPREGVSDFRERVARTAAETAKFNAELDAAGHMKVFDVCEVVPADRIAPELLEEAARITEARFGFAARHVPGFYLRRGMGPFWGGCMLGDPESGFAVFLLRDAFRTRTRFLSCRRDELLAHELCHTARQSLNDPETEEFFAYRTSDSPLRRYLGGCFITDRDAWGFVLPALLLPAAELIRARLVPDFPVWIFWLLAAVYPLWLLARNFRTRRLVRRARRAVAAAGAENPDAVLFRCTGSEIAELGRLSGPEVARIVRERREVSPRWAVLAGRFFPGAAKEAVV